MVSVSKTLRSLAFTVISVTMLVSCVRSDPVQPPSANAPTPVPRVRTVLAMGDSLTAGYELPSEASYPSQLEKRLKESGYDYSVVNAWVSGDTSAGLLERTDWLLAGDLPDLAVLCIGSNDGLQGLPPDQMDANVRAILAKLREKGVPVVLIGIKVPRNLGLEYVAKLEAVHPKIASDLSLPFIPFLLEGIAKDPKYNLPDGIHPNAEGAAIVAKNVFSFLVEKELVSK